MARLGLLLLAVYLLAEAQGVCSVFAPGAPKWVRMTIPQRPRSQRDYEMNVAEVKAADRANRRFDLIFYGDSITTEFREDKSSVWNRYFRGKLASPFSMIGSNIQELAWRIVAGGETPKLPPKVVVLHIGIINLRWRKDDPADYLEWLIQWIQRNMKGTRIVVLGLMPNKHLDVGPTNKKYKAIADRLGAEYSDCAKGVAPRDPKLTRDGTHPTAAGQRVVLDCLRPAVDKWI